MERYLITKSGYEAMKLELETLKTQERPKVISAISEARAHGDLKENAEYHSAREQQGFIEGRIRELEQKIAISEVIDPHQLPQNGKILFGMTAELENCDNQQQLKYQVVSEAESDIEEGRISYLSPLGKSLIGKSIGDTFGVQTPGGEQILKVLKVYP